MREQLVGKPEEGWDRSRFQPGDMGIERAKLTSWLVLLCLSQPLRPAAIVGTRVVVALGLHSPIVGDRPTGDRGGSSGALGAFAAVRGSIRIALDAVDDAGSWPSAVVGRPAGRQWERGRGKQQAVQGASHHAVRRQQPTLSQDHGVPLVWTLHGLARALPASRHRPRRRRRGHAKQGQGCQP
ncbi:hypothetical protein DB31_2175 [Hyalangium minutum]|uniref:Uncharacterized protein n=1 Tax=Hyalangium minutum TaxID=394096 RepID=A0A085W9L8_9BACT|nr:hypothetical protein DB31_2175 [Hyalangium minutum]